MDGFVRKPVIADLLSSAIRAVMRACPPREPVAAQARQETRPGMAPDSRNTAGSPVGMADADGAAGADPRRPVGSAADMSAKHPDVGPVHPSLPGSGAAFRPLRSKGSVESGAAFATAAGPVCRADAPDGAGAGGEGERAARPVLLDRPFLDSLSAEIGADAVREAMEIFLADAPATTEAISAAFESGAIAILRRRAHALAGASRGIGLLALGEDAYRLQKSLEAREPTREAVDSLMRLIGATCRQAEEWLAAEASRAAA
jgi:HPt (histidine-containing phosphotransfer) domain-containing protein